MKSINHILLFSVLLFLLGCRVLPSESDSLKLVQTSSPIKLDGITASFYENISYGVDKDNILDIFLPNSKDQTPLVIFVHGGGFVGGDKSHAYNESNIKRIRKFLKNNIAFATINYRFISNPDSDGVITSLNDSKKCLQFIRYHADKLNIDKERIVMYGSSAGAGTSLWLGFHDDMKDSASQDPILRESTRLKAVGALETQASYDLYKWWSVVFKHYDFSMEKMAGMGMLETIKNFYNVSSIEGLESERIRRYRRNIDFFDLMSQDDPPIFVQNEKYPIEISLSKKNINHHALHAKSLKVYADSIGIESVFYIPKLNIEDSTGISLVEFLIDNVK